MIIDLSVSEAKFYIQPILTWLTMFAAIPDKRSNRRNKKKSSDCSKNRGNDCCGAFTGSQNTIQLTC